MTMPILDIQKRARELGRIRLGQKSANGAPQKLDRFRLTSASQPLLDKVATLYGGEVKPWTPDGGSPQFEVLTDARRLPIMVPPQPVSQWFEYWTRAGCQHRCDGRTNVLTDEFCDPEDFKHAEALKKPTTRLSVVLRDVEGIGVWRVETHGWNAAVELPDVAEFLAAAGGYVEGWLALEQRTSVEQTDQGPKTRHFMVPIIEIDVTPAELMAGRGRVQTPTLEGPVQRPALVAGQAEPDAFTPFFDRLPQVSTIKGLQDLWTEMVAAKLVGTQAQASPRATEFLAAYKARATDVAALQAPAPAPAAEEKPDADGAYEADWSEAPVDDTSTVDPELVWHQIIATAGSLANPMQTSEVREDFQQRMGGLLPDDASAGELQAYLGILNQEPAA